MFDYYYWLASYNERRGGAVLKLPCVFVLLFLEPALEGLMNRTLVCREKVT